VPRESWSNVLVNPVVDFATRFPFASCECVVPCSRLGLFAEAPTDSVIWTVAGSRLAMRAGGRWQRPRRSHAPSPPSGKEITATPFSTTPASFAEGHVPSSVTRQASAAKSAKVSAASNAAAGARPNARATLP
jgi:hypothetical protein